MVAGMRAEFGEYQHGGIWNAEVTLPLSDPNPTASEIAAIREHGPFEIDGEKELMQALDALLQAFVDQQRMKLPGTRYNPCYRIVT